MAVEAGSILRAVATFDLGGFSIAQNRYHVALMNEADQGDEDVVEACKTYVAAIMANVAGIIAPTVSLEFVETYLYNAGLWEPLGSATSTWVGTGTGDRLPSGVAAMLTATKARSGYLDRKYLAGLTEAQVSGDEWVAGALTALGNAADDWVAEYTAGNGVLLQPISVNESTGIAKYLVSGAAVARVAYQRRRKPGVGLT